MTQKLATHTIRIENEQVRVTEWRFGPGDATGHHIHQHDYVVVPIMSAVMTLVEPNGGKVKSTLELGKPYFRHAGVEHDVVNSNNHDMAFIEIELKQTRIEPTR